MYEVEIKVELTDAEREKILAVFKDKKFTFKGITPQNDYYIEAKKSEYKGYNLKRYRQEADTFIYTEKIWEMVDGSPARKENEHEVTKEEFESQIAAFPHAIKIKKDREWIAGSYKGTDLSITIDSVKFDHSPEMRYFLEAEIGVEDKNKVKETEAFIHEFLKELLGREIPDAPGMFMMAFEKR